MVILRLYSLVDNEKNTLGLPAILMTMRMRLQFAFPLNPESTC